MIDVYVFGSGRRGWRGERVDERMRGLGSCGNRGSGGRVCVFGLRWCGWFRWGWVVGWTKVWRGEVVLCLYEL